MMVDSVCIAPPFTAPVRRKRLPSDRAKKARLKDAIVTCNSCHAILGKWGDIKAVALTELKRLVKEDLKDYFGE